MSGAGPMVQPGSPTPPDHEEHFFSSIEIPETSSASHRLPTPDSLEQDDDCVERAVIPSSPQFDDDELDLLSLAGADVGDLHSSQTQYDVDDTYPTPDEPIPSIEDAEFRNEDEIQLEMLKAESPTPEPTLPKLLPSTIPETQESVVVVSSPSQKQRKIEAPRPNPVSTHRAASDSSDDLDLIGTNEEPATPRNIPIKREPETPQASLFLCSSPAFKTSRPVPQSSGLAKSTGKLDRRAYLKEAKQSWTKGRGRMSGGKRRKRISSALPVNMKRARVDVEVGDSEDELAL